MWQIYIRHIFPRARFRCRGGSISKGKHLWMKWGVYKLSSYFFLGIKWWESTDWEGGGSQWGRVYTSMLRRTAILWHDNIARKFWRVCWCECFFSPTSPPPPLTTQNFGKTQLRNEEAHPAISQSLVSDVSKAPRGWSFLKQGSSRVMCMFAHIFFFPPESW